ncbi:MAG: Na(+)-translocating NADH-quinone reductase subunit A [Gammaproteobacteria bacterium TMED226]|nr:MAG: Na(+)-translocating NADH-quinone reductase subunit A [Gammaproteobacteria bacterium TMED226]
MIKISKGLDLPISGVPKKTVSDEPNSSSVSLLGNDFIGMKPTMMVKEGDHVKAGQNIFEDKKNPGIFYSSPAGGTIKSINRGDKRKFLSVEIDISKNEDFKVFEMDGSLETIKSSIISSGLWNAFRTRPFNRTPSPNKSPKALFINCCDTNPLCADPYEIIKYDKDLFDNGLNLIQMLFDCDIHLSYQKYDFDTSNSNINYHQFQGPHPAGLSSTHISMIDPVNINKTVWTINYQDIISLGYLKANKKIRTHKIISLAGPAVHEPSLLKVRICGNIDEITAGKINNGSRIISGSVLHGHSAEGVMNYLGFYDSQISVIPDEVNEIFMNWLMPGTNLHSKLNVFISTFMKPNKFIFNTSMGGGDRSIVPISSYEEVLPMDILATQLLKSLVVGDIEMAIDLGMLELIPEDLALCSYVCPSKYDYSSILMDNLNKLYLEL